MNGKPPFYVKSVQLLPNGWRTEWNVYKRAQGGGDRWVCRASSERTARAIARALNAEEAR